MAEEFAARFRELTGAALPTAEETEASEEQLAAGSTIMVGNVATGPLSLRLYARRLIYADAAFPGAGGHELRTVHDPWGAGTNVVYVGGSDPEGCRAAADALLERIEPAEDVTLPVITEWQSEMRTFGPISDEDIELVVSDLEAYLHSFTGAYQYKSAAGRPSLHARAYYLGGGDSHARAYAEMVRVLREYYEETPGVDPPTFTLESIVAGLDQIEECEALSDEDRLMAEEWVRQIVEDSMDYWEMRDPIARYEAGRQAPTWNHQTHPAVGIAFAAEYFNAHFDLPQVRWWEGVVDNLFAGQESSYKPLEDSANYQWITLVHTMQWALITGDMDIFENGTIAKCCELAIACHDNFGHEATFGDPWIEFGSNARTLMRIASLYYDDPRFRWLVQRLDANAGAEVVLGYYNLGGEAQARSEQVGLTTFILDPAVHDEYAYDGPVPADSAPDKAVFRSGFEPEDSYLMLDGIAMGIHDHDDANALIRYTDNGRLWLCDMDYIRATPRWHSSIMLSRDGRTTAVPGLSERVAEAELADGAIVQSRAPGYAWTDWTRTVLWWDDAFMVMDDLKAAEPGDFRATAVWRTLGGTAIEGNRLEVEQQGEHFFITNADGARLSLRETWDRGHGNDRCDAGDLDGDGRDEVLAGSEYYGSKILDAAGEIVGSVSGGPNWPACRAVDLDVDGDAEALFGADDAIVRVRSGEGDALWEANVGGSVTDIVGLTPDAGAAVAVSSRAGSVYGFGGDGDVRWRTELPEQVSDLATLNTRLAAACDDGTVYLLDADGTILGGHRGRARPGALSAGDLRGAGSATIIAARGGELQALTVD